jgi:hypothetical protein
MLSNPPSSLQGCGPARAGGAALLCAVLMGGCAAPPTAPDDACQATAWFDRADAAQVQQFWLQLLSWPAERFQSQCSAPADLAGVLPPQRLRLALAYGAPANPRRSADEVQRLLAGPGLDGSAETQAAARFVREITAQQFAQERQVTLLKAQLDDAQARGVRELERGDTEARRAADAQRRAAAAEERLRASEQRFAEVNLRLNEATRRLEALKSVEEAISRRAALRRSAGAAATPPAPAAAPVVPTPPPSSAPR